VKLSPAGGEFQLARKNNSMFHRIRALGNSLQVEWRSAIWSSRWNGKQKPLSALIRVRDGGEFLAVATESIIEAVDEVVLVDNRSQDDTPKIIERLAARYPDKIRSFRYDHDVVPVGEDSYNLDKEQPRSPRLAHNYSNWCMARCRHPFVLKWDDDMIATRQLIGEIEKFKSSRFLQFDFGGHNISADFKQVLEWKAGIEPRIFPANTKFSMVDFAGVVKSGKSGKYAGDALSPWVAEKYRLRSEEELYAHLKYCKRNPGKNQSAGFRQELETEIRPGGAIPDEFLLTLERFNLIGGKSYQAQKHRLP
jgi:glycosyltransferase involved in cell wall biosynthesis